MRLTLEADSYVNLNNLEPLLIIALNYLLCLFCHQITLNQIKHFSYDMTHNSPSEGKKQNENTLEAPQLKRRGLRRHYDVISLNRPPVTSRV